MQRKKFKNIEIAQFGMGTKRLPTTDVSRVVRLDTAVASEIADSAIANGVNYFETSYSNHKGESEAFLGDYFEKRGKGDCVVSTSFFEMVDPRFEHVLREQLRKLKTDSIDFYHIEGVCDMNRMREVDSGAIDYLFEQKEKGAIKNLGFSSELSTKYLDDYIKSYPWDFVRMEINYFDWFERGVREQYEIVAENELPIFAHGALRTGNRSSLKPEALKVLNEYNQQRSSIEWALLFVKSLDAVVTTSSNIHSTREIEENASVFSTDTTLSEDEFKVLEEAAAVQKTIRPRV